MEHVRRVRILYKTILRLHRGLPEGLRTLGSDYVREEFKRHKTCGPVETEIFMKEWTKYALVLGEQLGIRNVKSTARNLGSQLTGEELGAMNNEQVCQLYELMKAAKMEE